MAEHAAVASAVTNFRNNRISAEENVMSKVRMEQETCLPKNLMSFNISGQCFIISTNLIQKYPSSKFGTPTLLSKHWLEELKVYYFDRDPVLFNTVLNLFRYDVLNVPPGYSQSLVEQEARYWKIPLDNVTTRKDDEEARIEAEFVWLENRIPPPSTHANIWVKKRYAMWCFLTDPLGPNTPYRRLSLMCCFLTIFLALLYLVLQGMGTSVYYRKPIDSGIEHYGNRTELSMEDMAVSIGCLPNMSKIDCYLNSVTDDWITYGKSTITLLFVLETVLRLLLCPGLAYFKSFLTWTDIVAGLSAMTSYILHETEPLKDREAQYTIILLQSVQVLRIFKIFQVFIQHAYIHTYT